MNNKECWAYKTIFVGFDFLEPDTPIVISRCCAATKNIYKKFDYTELENIDFLNEVKDAANNVKKPFYVCNKNQEPCDFETWDKISLVQVSLLTDCMASCEFCHRNPLHIPRDNKKEANAYFKFLNQLKCQGKGLVLTNAGEPLVLLKDHKEFFKSLKNGDFTEIILTTNGILIDDELIDIIKSSHIPFDINVSLNAPNKELYKEIVGIDAFDKVVENINKMYEFELNVTASMVYYEKLFGKLIDFENIVKCNKKIILKDSNTKYCTEEYNMFHNKKGWDFNF